MQNKSPEPIKRYLLFGLVNYYPRGGWGDFRSSHETFAKAVAAGNALRGDEWFEIVDCKTGDCMKMKYERTAYEILILRDNYPFYKFVLCADIEECRSVARKLTDELEAFDGMGYGVNIRHLNCFGEPFDTLPSFIASMLKSSIDKETK